MNVQQKDQKPASKERREAPLIAPTARLMTMTKPIGAFAGKEDFIVRMRNGEFVAADTGDQGGGQN